MNSGGPPDVPGRDAYLENQAYQARMASGAAGGHSPNPHGRHSPNPQGGHSPQPGPYDQHQQYAPQSSDPNAPNYDPNAPPMAEGERGLLGAAGGAFAGHKFGKKEGHGLLGTIGGGILGSLAEDFIKDKSKKHHHHHHSGGGSHHGGGGSHHSHHSSHGGSSWGGY